MAVINNQEARTIGLNGRVPLKEEGKSRPYAVVLNPGLNNVTEQDLQDLETNNQFIDLRDYGKLDITLQTVKKLVQEATEDTPEKVTTVQEPPETVESIDITAMNVRNARDVIDSCVDIVLLDAWEEAENATEKPRKGVLEKLVDQKAALVDLTNAGQKE